MRAILFIAVLVPSLLFAQTAILRSVITDQNGAIVPAATVDADGRKRLVEECHNALRNEVRYHVADAPFGVARPREIRRDESDRDRPEELGRRHFETDREEREGFAGNLASRSCAPGSGRSGTRSCSATSPALPSAIRENHSRGEAA